MASATASLPSDPEALRALAISLQEALATKDRELAARDAEIYAKTLHIEKLRATSGALAVVSRCRRTCRASGWYMKPPAPAPRAAAPR